MERKLLSVEAVMSAIESLSHSQGFYGRLLEQLNEAKESDEEKFNSDMKKFIEDNTICDTLDLVLAIEC